MPHKPAPENLPETPAPSEREKDMADYRETQAMSARTTKATLAALRAPRPVAASTAEVVLSDRRVVEWKEWDEPCARTLDIVTNKGRAGCESRRCFKSLDEMRAYPLPYADWQLIDAAFASRATPDGAPSDE